MRGQLDLLDLLRPAPVPVRPDRVPCLFKFPGSRPGGPVKTLADKPGGRHVPGGPQWGGYDTAANLIGGAQ